MTLVLVPEYDFPVASSIRVHFRVKLSPSGSVTPVTVKLPPATEENERLVLIIGAKLTVLEVPAGVVLLGVVPEAERALMVKLFRAVAVLPAVSLMSRPTWWRGQEVEGGDQLVEARLCCGE